MTNRFLPLFAAILLLGACSADGTKPFASAPNQPQHVCTVGQKVNVHDNNAGSAFQYDIVTMHETNDSRAWLSVGNSIGSRSVQAFQALKAVEDGKDTKHDLKRYRGAGTITFTGYYADAGSIPDRIWYLDRTDHCMDSVAVETFVHEGKLAWRFTVPMVEGGAHPLFLRKWVQNKQGAFLLCTTYNGVNIYAPELTAGPARGQKNTVCALPGSGPGTTHIDEVSRNPKKTWDMMTNVLRERVTN